MSLFSKVHFSPRFKNFDRHYNFHAGWVVKDWFFDKEPVSKLLDKETRIAFQKFGHAVMIDARKSMPWRKGPSKPGQPPHAHKIGGKIRAGGNIKWGPWSVHYAYDPIRKGVIIGPEKFPERQDYVPRQMEYGSHSVASQVSVNPRRKFRRVGDAGVIRIVEKMPKKPRQPRAPKAPKAGASQARRDRYQTAQTVYRMRMERYRQDVKDWQEGKKKIKKVIGQDGKSWLVVFAKLRTQKQAHYCMSLEKVIWGPFKWRNNRIAPRPYMRPAYARQISNLPRFYQEAQVKVYS